METNNDSPWLEGERPMIMENFSDHKREKVSKERSLSASLGTLMDCSLYGSFNCWNLIILDSEPDVKIKGEAIYFSIIIMYMTIIVWSQG